MAMGVELSQFGRVARAIKAVPESERAAWPYVFGVAAVGLTSAIVLFVGGNLSVADASMLHLLPILLIAVRFGIWPSILTSVVAAMSCNFLFSRPYFGFGLQDFPDLFTLAVFLITAVTVNYWAGEAHRHGEILRQRHAETALLYRINRRLAGVVDAQEIVQGVEAELSNQERVAMALYLARGSVLELAAAVGNTWAGSIEESRAAEAALRGPGESGNGTERVGEAILRYLPIEIDGMVLGVLGITPRRGADSFYPALAAEIGQAIDRGRRVEERERAAVMSEVARLQSALVTSISHDFRTPLATIIGAASSLQDDAVNFTPTARRELLKGVQEAGERLHRYVSNLLSTGQLEAGALKLNRHLIGVGELLATAVAQFSPADLNRRISLTVPNDLPPLDLDAVLIEQVLLNLIDNAVKYSVPDSRICISARNKAGCVVIEISNMTTSIPKDLDRIFDRFYRPVDRAGDGSGLGLSICKGFVEAHGGRITAHAANGVFSIVVEFISGAETPPIAAEFSNG